MATPKQTDPQFKLRLTPQLKERIENAAFANNRSLNAEILARLDDVDRLASEFSETTKLLEKREEALFRDRVELRHLRPERDRLIESVKEKDARIVELEREHARLSVEVAEAKSKIAFLEERSDQPSSETIQRLEDAIEGLRRSVEEGRRHFEEVEKPVLAEALAMNKVLRIIAEEGADETTMKFLKDFVKEDAGGFERVVEKLTAQPREGLFRKATEFLSSRAAPVISRPTPEEWDLLRSAPEDRQPAILQALASADVDGAVEASQNPSPRTAKKRSA